MFSDGGLHPEIVICMHISKKSYLKNERDRMSLTHTETHSDKLDNSQCCLILLRNGLCSSSLAWNVRNDV